MKIRSTVVASLPALCVATLLAAEGGGVQTQGGMAQPAAAARTRVATVQVKPDLVRAWLDLQRTEAVPAIKKGGVAWRWGFSNGGPVGPGSTYTIVQPVTDYAQFDAGPAMRRAMTPEAYARFQDKERAMVVGTSAIVQTLVPEASIVSGSATPPTLARVTTIQLLPFRGQDFAALMASDYAPAMKKAAVKDYWVFATNLGGRLGQRTIVEPLTKWADLDAPSPLLRALGPEGARSLNGRRSQLEASVEVTVLSFVPELSFGVPPPPATR